MASTMAKHTFAGTVMSHGQNTNREGQIVPGGNMLVDFKVKDGLALKQHTLARVRLNNNEAYDYMLENGLGKGAQISIMADGVHEHDVARGDGFLPPKGDKPARPIRKFMRCDLNTARVIKGVSKFDDSVSEDAADNKAVAGLVANLAKSAAAAFRPATEVSLDVVEITKVIPQATEASAEAQVAG